VTALRQAGMQVSTITRDSAPGPGIRLSTMHRAKGLEFRAVFIVACCVDQVPQAYSGEHDLGAQADHMERERTLLYAAMTRAREELWISGVRPLSPFLEHLA
jgi:superfamily I DNA/RNA helicase